MLHSLSPPQVKGHRVGKGRRRRGDGGMDIAAEPAEDFNLDSYSAAALESLLGETGNNAHGGQTQLQQGRRIQIKIATIIRQTYLEIYSVLHFSEKFHHPEFSVTSKDEECSCYGSSIINVRQEVEDDMTFDEGSLCHSCYPYRRDFHRKSHT